MTKSGWFSMWWRITIAYAQRKQNRLFRHNAWLLNFYNDFCILVHEELIAFKYHYWMKQQESSEDSPAPKMYRWVCETGFFLFCLLPLFTPASFTLYLRLLSFLKVFFFFFLVTHCLSPLVLLFHLSVQLFFLKFSFIPIIVLLWMSFILIEERGVKEVVCAWGLGNAPYASLKKLLCFSNPALHLLFWHSCCLQILNFPGFQSEPASFPCSVLLQSWVSGHCSTDSLASKQQLRLLTWECALSWCLHLVGLGLLKNTYTLS